MITSKPLILNIYANDNSKDPTYRLRFVTDLGKFGFNIPFSKNELDYKMNDVNDLLEQIVLRHQNEYENGIHIPQNICDQDLEEIAKLNLFDFFFVDRVSDAERAQEAAEEITRLCNERIQVIQIISEKGFIFPWALMYYGPRKGKTDPNAFWGFKHVIQEAPDQQYKLGSFINSNDLLVGLNINNTVDPTGVTEHTDFFTRIEQSHNIKFKWRNKEKEVLDAFAQEELLESVIYFYCHAKFGPLDKKSVDKSWIELTEKNSVLTLGDLKYKANTARTFLREPIVFINACESGGLSPLFYDGFVPYFLRKGSRGVVGTLSKIPAVFASRFGLEFFKRLLCGNGIDWIISQLRQEYLFQYNNILGLYYVSFCNFDLALNPPIINHTNSQND